MRTLWFTAAIVGITAACALGMTTEAQAGQWKQDTAGTGGRTMTEVTPQAAGIGWTATGMGFPSAITLMETATWQPIPPPRTGTRWMEAAPG